MVRNILVVGAGKSTSYLLEYLLGKSGEEQLHLKIGDLHPESIPKSIGGHPNCSVFAMDILNAEQRREAITDAAVVISMLPASLHIIVARDCLKFKKHLVTASYISEELQALDGEVKQIGRAHVRTPVTRQTRRP